MKSKRSPAQVLDDLIHFAEQYNRFPSQNGFGEERSLALAIANYKSKDRFTPEQLAKVKELRSTYSKRQAPTKPEEKFEELKSFCEQKGRFPDQNSKDEYERKLYFRCRRQAFENRPELQNKFNELAEKFNRGTSPEKIVQDLKSFVYKHHYTPRESSHIASEKKLAEQIKSKKSRNAFSEEQLESIKYLYDKYGSASGTSVWEQIIYHYLKYQLGSVEICNRDKRFGNEVDIFIQFDNHQIAIFYDGAYFHSQVLTMEKDNDFNQHLAQNKVQVFRFREKGCPKLKDCENLCTIEVKPQNEKNFLVTYVEPFFNNIFGPLGYNVKPYEINKIVREARMKSSSRYIAKTHLLDYISVCIYNESKTDKHSNIYRNCKSCLQRNHFSDNESLLYAFTKRLYDPSPKLKRNTDAPSATNDDVELLFQIFESIYRNTHYDPAFLKEKIIEKINDMQ